MKHSQHMRGWYRYTRGYHLAVVTLALLSACFLLFTSVSQTSALTTVPTKMNFQGRLTDASGNIKPNGMYNMRFKLYTVSTAGSPVWSEDRLNGSTGGVSVVNGLFSVKLGEVSTLPASLFASGELYLEVELPTPASATTTSPVWTEGPMTPRNQMATSAYAYNAETLDGLDSAAFGQLSTTNTWSGTNTFSGSVLAQSSLTLGTTAAQGSLVVHDGNGQTATLVVADTAGSYTYTLPVTTASDTFCMLTLANCGSGGGISTVGALDGGTANANGATISGSTIYLQSASGTYSGLVSTGTQTFAGNKTFSGTLTVSNSATFSGQLTVGVADTTGILLVLDTKTDAGDPTGTAGAMYYNSSLGKFRCYQGVAWTDCIGSGGSVGVQRVTLVPEYVGAVLTPDGTNNNVNVTASSSSGLSSAQGYKHNFYQWDTTTVTAQDYDIVINYQLPSNFTSFVANSFNVWTYADSLTSTDATFMVKSSTDALCYASTVSVKPSVAATWENKAPGTPGNGCTFAANDIITIIIKPTVIQPSTNKVKIGELRFEYQ